MMYGHLEKDEDIIETLSHIRNVQDEAIESKPAKFTAFIPWSFKKDNTALVKKIKKESKAEESKLNHDQAKSKAMQDIETLKQKNPMCLFYSSLFETLRVTN